MSFPKYINNVIKVAYSVKRNLLKRLLMMQRIPGIGTVGGAAFGAVVGTILSIVIVGKVGSLLNKKNDNGKSVIDQIKDYIWDIANGGLKNNCTVNE